MFLTDCINGVQEGAVLQYTMLARDAMASLAWAIEKKVQSVSGEPLDRVIHTVGFVIGFPEARCVGPRLEATSKGGSNQGQEHDLACRSQKRTPWLST
jgi:hypothetical protein